MGDDGERAGARRSDVKPEHDATFAIVSGIADVVPVSRWAFARVEASGELVSLFVTTSNDEIASLGAELKRQRAKAANGPRIAATLGSLKSFASGVTLLFADARSNYGILTLSRTAELGPFTSSEISILTFALDAISDFLATLRLQPPATPIGVRLQPVEVPLRPETPDGAFYILDTDLQITLAWTDEQQRRVALTGLQTRVADRLPIMIEESVRELTSAWLPGASNRPGVSRPVAFLVVRTQPMTGRDGLFIGVHIDRYLPTNSLTGAAARFHISPREIQVLALLLDGNHLDQIAKQLYITSSTVQDHIKSMLDKTESRNRSELIARVLGWEIATTATPLP
jgi:DNA-binding CsgD family transcriptional regulator